MGDDARVVELEEELENRTIELQMAAEFGQRLLAEDHKQKAIIGKLREEIAELSSGLSTSRK